MGQTREALTQNLTERWCWQAARRDDARVARRLYRKPVVAGVYRLDEGALLDDFFQFWRELGGFDLMEGVQGKARQREMVPVVQDLLRYGLKTLFGIDRMKALPALLIDAGTKMPLAVKVVPIHEHAVLSMRALVAQARTHLEGAARLHKVVFDRGFLDGVDRWWLDQQGITFVVPAKDHMAVTADARAQAAAGEGITVGRRVHTVRHGQGTTARRERQETEVVGITGLTTYDQYGTPEHGHHHHRRDVEANPIHAVVVRQWHGRDDGPGGTTVFLTNASVQQPLHPFDDDDDRRLIEHCCIKEAKQPWDLGHPPQKTGRAVRVHVVFTFLMFALATAYRLRCAHATVRAEPMGWQQWRRQLLEQTRDKVIVFAQRRYGIVHLAEFALLVGVKLQDAPPGMGTRHEVLAKYALIV